MEQKMRMMQNIRCISKFYEREIGLAAQKVNLSRLEAAILLFLYHNPSRDLASDIVECRQLSKANVSQGVDALIRKGLLSRNADEEDRRCVHLHITLAGKALLPGLLEAQDAFVTALTADFSPEERVMFGKMCDRIACNAKKNLEER